MSIEVTATKDGQEATLNYDFGSDINDAIAKFGAEVVFTNFRQAAKIALQARMRSRMEKKGNVQELATIWKPGIQLERAAVDPVVAAKNAFANMSAEDREAFLNELRAVA